jgi:hypothetical protein
MDLVEVEMKYKEIRQMATFRPEVDSKCAHCMECFEDEDDLGRCSLTEHYTHVTCIGHDQ